MLTNEQKQYFSTFGFLVLPELFSAQEADLIRRESERIFLKGRDGKPFDGKKRQCMIPFYEHSPELTRILEDDRIYSIGEDLLGPDFVMECTEGNLHVGDTQWHGGDPVPVGQLNIKVNFNLEPVTAETGALRVIPGSHLPGFKERMEPLVARHTDPPAMPFGVPGPDIPSFVLESQPGDVVVFPETIWHGAFGGASGRIQHAISFNTNTVTDEHVAWVRDFYNRAQPAWQPCESLINSDRPRLRRLVARLVELGFDSLPY